MIPSDTGIARLDWAAIAVQLDAEGYALLPGLFDAAAARELLQLAAHADAVRTSLASGSLGSGELIHFGVALPALLENLRAALYPPLAVIANRWNEIPGVAGRFPAALRDFQQLNRSAGQARAQSHLNRLRAEDHIALHQCNDGEVVFPLQFVALLSAPGTDFTGGEFVMTEQRPRMQSRPMVLPLALGDAAIIATAERPFRGSKGYYRVNLKHAVSRVRQGRRVGLELSFHDAR
ncbi:2OG-Fe(II) oxygenase [Tahibacter harae]|uniref:2OG-Fe(II) oxygenase n=1 Tax=Tahibacter harae TaxID=2963937 RepID=A0ABT1QWF5_9GAMM|nr:2OG-Fe(II) oxygenase [Tahibacter harae]